MHDLLQQLKQELEEELDAILAYWMRYGTDGEQEGFIGQVDRFNQPNLQADKGSVLNSRILWTFSAAFRRTKEPAYLQYARRAYEYFYHFVDTAYGGVYWSVTHEGQPADKKKQVYAQSFAVYALSEFYRASGLEAARQEAIGLFKLIELHSFDPERGGYLDAFTESWTALPDVRLSAKDANEKKTMNTHLHILEGYTNLYRIWPDAILKAAIAALLQNFIDHIIDKKNNHLILFFDEDWTAKSSLVSYGHDIEAAWLLQEAAETINSNELLAFTKQAALQLAVAAKEGLDADGGLWYEFEPATAHLIKEKHWWPQAEAMVGFFNAWQVSGSAVYLWTAVSNWHFIKKYLRDQQYGEWVWGVNADYSIMAGQDKIGIWKCPYHNGRACMEIIDRIDRMKKNG